MRVSTELGDPAYEADAQYEVFLDGVRLRRLYRR
jgi:hypothetical protein